MNKRLLDISKKLEEFAVGNFNGKPLRISNARDEDDAITNAINMMGEELKAITISRDYFNDIFNSVTDMLLLLTKKGGITDCNETAQTELAYSHDELTHMKLSDLFKRKSVSIRKILLSLQTTGEFIKKDIILNRKGEGTPVKIKAVLLRDKRSSSSLLLTVTNIAHEQAKDNLVIKTIINTQEVERQRLAQELHDSVAQQISGSIYYITATAHTMRASFNKKALITATSILQGVKQELEASCFDLMPGTLRRFGLLKTIQECCSRFLTPAGICYRLQCRGSLPPMTPALQRTVYRVIQELTGNVLKHAGASKVVIKLVVLNDQFALYFSDNGCGFDSSLPSDGMGLDNIASRVRTHEGELQVKSRPGKGTKYSIKIPLKTDI